MCGFGFGSQYLNTNATRDNLRGRYLDPARFTRIKEYAQRRWDRTQNLRHSRRWYGIIESVESRRPY